MVDRLSADEFITRVRGYGIRPGLDRIHMLLERLGSPQRELKVIHVAGTNGKGSVCTMLGFALTYNDYKVGKFSSPALISEYEQFTIDNDMISEAEYLGFLSEIIDAVSSFTEDEMPTYFEVQFALAMLFFAANHVDFAIIETGMGGRLDATNVFTDVVCAVITSISLDHMNYLGDTLAKIADHKAGIMKKGCYAVSTKQEEEVIRVLREHAGAIDANLVLVDYNHVRYNRVKNMVSYREFKDVTIPFFGDFQLDNTLLALEVLHILKYQRIELDIHRAIDGIRHAYLPGRMERISTKPLIYIDGCHNADAAIRIRETINNHFKDKSITFILGVLKDKEVSRMISILLPHGDSLVTVTPNNPRAMAADMLANDCFLYDIDVSIARDFDDAIRKALSYDNDVIIALGSLSYLADIKEAFLHEDNGDT